MHSLGLHEKQCYWTCDIRTCDDGTPGQVSDVLSRAWGCFSSVLSVANERVTGAVLLHGLFPDLVRIKAHILAICVWCMSRCFVSSK